MLSSEEALPGSSSHVPQGVPLQGPSVQECSTATTGHQHPELAGGSTGMVPARAILPLTALSLHIHHLPYATPPEAGTGQAGYSSCGIPLRVPAEGSLPQGHGQRLEQDCIEPFLAIKHLSHPLHSPSHHTRAPNDPPQHQGNWNSRGRGNGEQAAEADALQCLGHRQPHRAAGPVVTQTPAVSHWKGRLGLGQDTDASAGARLQCWPCIWQQH